MLLAFPAVAAVVEAGARAFLASSQSFGELVGFSPVRWPSSPGAARTAGSLLPAAPQRRGRPLRAVREGLQGLTVRELKVRLREEGLPVGGKKADLIVRLQGYLAAQEAAAPAAAGEAQEVAGAAEAEVQGGGPPASFAAGDVVEAWAEGDSQWYGATVQRDHNDGTFMVTWHEDDTEYTCTPDKMKLVKKAEAPASFFAGDVVEAFWEQDQQWHPARVKMNNGNGEFIVIWKTDGIEYHCRPQHMRYPKPKLAVGELKKGQKFKGRVGRSFRFGTFVDIGAECDGLVAPYYMYEGEGEPLAKGDFVQALYEEENRFYPARIVRDHGDGGFTVSWEEDSVEYTCKKEDLRLTRPSSLDYGVEVDVWVNEVSTGPTGQQRLSLTMVESKVGKQRPLILSPLASLSKGDWLKGSVLSTLPFGIFVNVDPPTGGHPVRGLVHITQIRDGFVEKTEDEVEIGQEVKVRVTAVDASAGRLDLSMKP